jgi:hypothetical protein
VHEAIAWLLDARAFTRTRRRAWSQLVSDLRLSFKHLGPALHRRLDPHLRATMSSLELEEDASPRDRARASRTLTSLLAALDSGEAVVAAWHDLLTVYRNTAASPELCDLRESQLAALARLRGLDWTFLPGRLGRTLAGHGDLVDSLAEGESRFGAKVDNRPVAERQASCDIYLAQGVPEADVVVWVAISDLAIWRWVIELDRIRFYDGRWWSSVVKAGAGQLPPELADRTQMELDSLFFGLLNRDEDADPFVVARVELANIRLPSAVERAQSVAEEVMLAAGLRAGELRGVPFQGGVVFSNGQVVGGNTFSLEGDFAAARRGRPNDRALGESLLDLEPKLLTAVHSDDQRLAVALTSVDWLRETKDLTASQQLGLSLRAIEQVFSETDNRHWRAAVYERLRHPWALARIEDLLVEVVYRAVLALGGGAMTVPPTEQQRADFLEGREYIMGGETFKLRRAVQRLGWLRQRTDGGSRLARELRTLESRLSSGQAAAKWLDEIEVEFARNLNRVHRLRNAILHGYPIHRDVVAASSTFARAISIHAAHALINATATGQDLAKHLNALRDDYASCRRKLESGTEPADAFGWTAGQ